MREMTDEIEKRNREKKLERRTTTKRAGERGRQFRNYGILSGMNEFFFMETRHMG